ncbi:MAG: helix-turn-helix domain-containing protein [Roseiflexaceae bacterium]
MPTIQSLRRSRGMTLVELALAAGVPARMLGAIELGILPLDGEYAARLAAPFGIAPALLCTVGAAPAVPRTRAGALRGAMLAATLLGGLLCHASTPDYVPRTNRSTTQFTQSNDLPRRLTLSASRTQPFLVPSTTQHRRQLAPATRHAAPVAIPTATPTSTPIPATPTALATPTPAAPRTMAVLPLPPDGPFRQNVVAALTANRGALQHVVVPPGETWSFNRAVGDPDLLDLVTISGVYGGGWCDLASRYVLALRPLLPQDALVFTRHVDATGYSLADIADDAAVAIWNTNGGGGEHDLLVHNTSSRMLVVDASLVGSEVQVRATYR